MRIIGGQFRGRSIAVPNTQATRPTMDRTREAVFNMLLNAPWAKGEDGTPLMRGARVLDVFAGSGAYGLEALSHKAAHVTFFDNNRQASQVIESNIAKFQVEPQIKMIFGDVLKIPSGNNTADIAFFDPPYGQGMLDKTITMMRKKEWLSDQTLLVIETESKTAEIVPKMAVLSERIYGKSKIVIGRLEG